MVRRGSMYLVLIFLSVAMRLIEGSVSDGDIRQFDPFWDAEMTYIREKCDEISPGKFAHHLKYSFDSSACQLTMNHWKNVTRRNYNRTLEYFEYFDWHCHDITEAAAHCWHNIMLHMETCFNSATSYVDIDKGRYMNFNKFLEFVCFNKDSNAYRTFIEDEHKIANSDLHLADDGCTINPEQLDYEDPSYGLSYTKKKTPRLIFCESCNDYLACSYRKAFNVTPKLALIREFTVQTMKKVAPCNKITSIDRVMNLVHQSIQLKDLLWLNSSVGSTINYFSLSILIFLSGFLILVCK